MQQASMAYLSSSGVQAAGSAVFSQLQTQMAQRAADQAEQTARSLRAKSDAAQRVADRAREEARSLRVESDRAQGSADSARRGLAVEQSYQQMKSDLATTYDRVAVARQTASGTATTTSPTVQVTTGQSPAPGSVIDTTA